MGKPTIQQQLVGLQDKLLSFAMMLTENKDDARDLFQETALKALDNEDKFVVDTNFKGWVFTLMRNIFINNYRRMVRNQKILLPGDELYKLNMPTSSAYASPDGALTLKEITRVLDNLEEDIRTPFTMHVSGYKYHEIAENLDLPIGTVKSRIFLARKNLMHSLKDYK